MSLSLNDAVVVGCIVMVVVTLILFAVVVYEKYSPKSVSWNRLNLLAASTNFVTLFSIVPQLLLDGRTGPECRLLHHWCGSWYLISLTLVRVFFLLRSDMVVTDNKRQAAIGRRLLVFWVVVSLINLISFNLTMTTFLIPPDSTCAVQLHPALALLFGIVIPNLFDVVVNARFIYFIFKTSRAARSVSDSTRRLLRLTCLMSFTSMTMSLIVSLILLRAIPLPDPSLLTPIFCVLESYSACTMVWPAIYVRLMKFVRDPPATNQMLSPSKQSARDASVKVSRTSNKTSTIPIMQI